LFSFFYFYHAGKIQLIGTHPVNARVYPHILAVLLGIFSLSMIITSAVKQIKDTDTMRKDEPPKTDYSGVMRIVLTILLLFVYVLLLKTVGFLIMTILYAFFQTVILTPKDQRKYKNILIVSIVFPALIYVIFYYGFKLILPQGSCTI
jgi:ABC-type Na+ efflux pump permease subunit